MTKKAVVLVIGIFILILLTSCANKSDEFDQQAFKMDTIMDLKAFGSNSKTAVEAAYKRIDEIEQMASSSIGTSDVCKINASAGKEYVKVHPEIIKMLKTAVKYSFLSNGAFDISVGPLIKLWGIGTKNERVPAAEEIKSKLPLVNYKNISINDSENSVKLLKEGMEIDLGGIAKGYTADEVVKIFKNYNVNSAIINLGGSSVYTLGKKQDNSLWSIGVQHPRKELKKDYTCIIRMPQQALSTSGDYEKFFIKDGKRYHHILNPFDGYPGDSGVMSDTIVVDSNIPDCNMLADILTKVTFVSGIDKGLKIIDSIPGTACLAETKDFKVYKSSNWKLELEDISPDFTVMN